MSNPHHDDELLLFEAALLTEVERTVEGWLEEADCAEQWNTELESFCVRLDAALPLGLETPDLTCWPEGVPAPPEQLSEAAAPLWQLCRRDKHKGTVECLASAWLLYHLATVRIAGTYAEHGSRCE